ncbi:hypothetical protein BKA70DRAFT_1289982 [Coprinopsis sp. MPI-PUGE-AT-0042]|nr:hypothetical protein BKA70DRAFT_1289982 [Coprinopsis sp. MPI-PUGE-AT-0042]
MKRASSRRSPSPNPLLTPPPPARTLRITSYGYKNGPLVPKPAITFDLRNLPNPPKHVRNSQSGMYKPLQEWLFSIGEVKTRFESIAQAIQGRMSEVEEGDAFRKPPKATAEMPPKQDVEMKAGMDDDEEENESGQESDEEHEEAEEDTAEVSVGVFCQLGRHRSVAVVEELGKWRWNTRSEWDVVIGHRDLVVERTQAHKDRVRKKARDTKNRRGSYESD